MRSARTERTFRLRQRLCITKTRTKAGFTRQLLHATRVWIDTNVQHKNTLHLKKDDSLNQMAV